MKNLSDYTQAGLTEILNQSGAFFAFSNDQFLQNKKEGVTYVDMEGGLICPKENANSLFELIEKNHLKGIAQDIAENGLDQIIKRELANHEAYYTCSISDTLDSLQLYNVTTNQVLAIYNVERLNNQDW